MVDKRSQAGQSDVSRMSTSQRLKQMSTKASDRLVDAHKRSNMGGAGQVRQAKVNLNEILQENELYEDVLDQINRKLALRQAIDKASDAIERSKQGSELGSKYGFDNGSNAARSKASSTSKMSLIALSNKGKSCAHLELVILLLFCSHSETAGAGGNIFKRWDGVVGLEESAALHGPRPRRQLADLVRARASAKERPHGALAQTRAGQREEMSTPILILHLRWFSSGRKIASYLLKIGSAKLLQTLLVCKLPTS
jgi:hypothetical protein